MKIVAMGDLHGDLNSVKKIGKTEAYNLGVAGYKSIEIWFKMIKLYNTLKRKRES